MAPMKFEEQLRDKLEERKIQPSTASWEKLSNQLDEYESSTNKRAYWWIGIAASFIGILMLVTFLNRETATMKPEPVIVDTQDVETPFENEESSKSVVADQEVPKEALIKEEPVNNNKATNQPILKQELQKEQRKLVENSEDNAVAETTVNDKTVEMKKQPITFEEQKAKEVVAQIRALQEQKEVVTDAEIDALLNAAQKEIELKQLYNEATNKVDANALLQSVEEDLERSFRTRVFEMLQSGYKELKTAVAERNN